MYLDEDRSYSSVISSCCKLSLGIILLKISQQCLLLQMKDRNMSENVKALSNAIGHLEARETELTTLVKLKVSHMFS